MLLMLRLGALAGNELRSQKRVVADCLTRDMLTELFSNQQNQGRAST